MSYHSSCWFFLYPSFLLLLLYFNSEERICPERDLSKRPRCIYCLHFLTSTLCVTIHYLIDLPYRIVQ